MSLTSNSNLWISSGLVPRPSGWSLGVFHGFLFQLVSYCIVLSPWIPNYFGLVAARYHEKRYTAESGAPDGLCFSRREVTSCLPAGRGHSGPRATQSSQGWGEREGGCRRSWGSSVSSLPLLLGSDPLGPYSQPRACGSMPLTLCEKAVFFF